LKKDKKEEKIPNEIRKGETVKKLDELLGKDWWKRSLSEKVIKEMIPEQLDDEIKDKLGKVYESVRSM